MIRWQKMIKLARKGISSSPAQPPARLPRPIKYGWALALTAMVVLTTAVDLARPGNGATEKLRPLMDKILFYLLAPPVGPSGRTSEIPASGGALHLPAWEPIPPAVVQPGSSPAGQIAPAN